MRLRLARLVVASASGSLAAMSAGCGSQSTAPAAPKVYTAPVPGDLNVRGKRLDRGHAVAAYGSSEPELRANIIAARRLGYASRYVTVTSSGKRHTFSVFAQIVRGDNFIFVRGNKMMYVFPAETTSVTYAGNDVTTKIPQVPVSTALATIAKAKTQRFHGAYRAKSPSSKSRFATMWSSYRDPWQVNPDYEAVVDTTASSGATKPSSAANARKEEQLICRWGWDGYQCYYYYDYQGGGYYPYYYYYDVIASTGFSLSSPYDSTSNEEVAFDNPDAGNGQGTALDDRARRPSAARRSPQGARILSECFTHDSINTGGGIEVIVDGYCTGAAMSIMYVTPTIYDFNLQYIGAPGIPLASEFNYLGGSHYQATVFYGLGSLGLNEIGKFAITTTAYPFYDQPYAIVIPGIGETIHTFPFNALYSKYPQVNAYRGSGQEIPFPPGPAGPNLTVPNYLFQNCVNQQGQHGCQFRPGNYRNSVIGWYQANGWFVNYGYACHHIHPLAAGGGNDVSNGVLLSSTDHDKFTSWWARTTYLLGTSPAVVDPDCS